MKNQTTNPNDTYVIESNNAYVIDSYNPNNAYKRIRVFEYNEDDVNKAAKEALEVLESLSPK